MKTLTFLLLFLAFVCCADQTNGISRKLFNGPADKQGKPKFRVESVFRDGTRIMVVWERPNPEGTYIPSARAYYAGGDMLAIEGDEDRDGFLESLALFGQDGKHLELFHRHRDGSVNPADAQALLKAKKQNADIAAFAEKFMDTDTTVEELEDFIRESKKRLGSDKPKKRKSEN